jgi:hypothetical protein
VLHAPDLVLELILQQFGVDLVGARELPGIERLDLRQQLVCEHGALLISGGAHVVEPIIKAVVTECGRIHRGQRHHFIEIAL